VLDESTVAYRVTEITPKVGGGVKFSMTTDHLDAPGDPVVLVHVQSSYAKVQQFKAM